MLKPQSLKGKGLFSNLITKLTKQTLIHIGIDKITCYASYQPCQWAKTDVPAKRFGLPVEVLRPWQVGRNPFLLYLQYLSISLSFFEVRRTKTGFLEINALKPPVFLCIPKHTQKWMVLRTASNFWYPNKMPTPTITFQKKASCFVFVRFNPSPQKLSCYSKNSQDVG